MPSHSILPSPDHDLALNPTQDVVPRDDGDEIHLEAGQLRPGAIHGGLGSTGDTGAAGELEGAVLVETVAVLGRHTYVVCRRRKPRKYFAIISTT